MTLWYFLGTSSVRLRGIFLTLDHTEVSCQYDLLIRDIILYESKFVGIKPVIY